MIYRPHDYQTHAIQVVLDKPAAGCFLAMGLGKTSITLTAINELLNDRFAVSRVLVIAPLRVAEDTWARESAKWEHLKHLRISKALGSEKKRIAALNTDADIWIINRENTEWLVEHYKRKWPFDMVVIDELSSFKSPGSRRFRALRKVLPFISRIVGLTGTPAPNGLIDLWSQLYLLDRGERLGKTLGEYRDRYFTPGRRNRNVIFDWDLKPGAEEVIHRKISDICISMKSEDWLQLPERIDRTVPVRLSDQAQEKYDRMERDQIISLDGAEIVAGAAAIVVGKLLQMANGAVYDNQGDWRPVHDHKLEALEEIIEEANGNPVLVFYAYQHDADRIQEYFHNKQAITKLKDSADIENWNNGLVSVMLAHPASAGHGLNLQAGGNIIVWFGLTWSLELYQQANARLHRQGQTQAVIVHHLIAEGTVDEDVMKALEGKADMQEALIEAVKARIDKYECTG